MKDKVADLGNGTYKHELAYVPEPSSFKLFITKDGEKRELKQGEDYILEGNIVTLLKPHP